MKSFQCSYHEESEDGSFMDTILPLWFGVMKKMVRKNWDWALKQRKKGNGKHPHALPRRSSPPLRDLSWPSSSPALLRCSFFFLPPTAGAEKRTFRVSRGAFNACMWSIINVMPSPSHRLTVHVSSKFQADITRISFTWRVAAFDPDNFFFASCSTTPALLARRLPL